jgi:DNA-binding NarL/FixJ family response regulator
MTAAIAVLTVDDREPFRAAARAVLAAMPGFETVGEAASGEEALELAATLCPDLVLLDVHMPGIDGLETSRRLSEAHPGAVIVLVSADDDPCTDAARMCCGAATFLRKQELCPSRLADLWTRFGSSPANPRSEKEDAYGEVLPEPVDQ